MTWRTDSDEVILSLPGDEGYVCHGDVAKRPPLIQMASSVQDHTNRKGDHQDQAVSWSFPGRTPILQSLSSMCSRDHSLAYDPPHCL